MGTGINRSRVFFRRPVLDSATSSVATASVATRFVAASAAAGFVATGFVATGFVATDFVATASVATAATSPTDGRQSRVLQLMLKCWAGGYIPAWCRLRPSLHPARRRRRHPRHLVERACRRHGRN